MGPRKNPNLATRKRRDEQSSSQAVSAANARSRRIQKAGRSFGSLGAARLGRAGYRVLRATGPLANIRDGLWTKTRRKKQIADFIHELRKHGQWERVFEKLPPKGRGTYTDGRLQQPVSSSTEAENGYFLQRLQEEVKMLVIDQKNANFFKEPASRWF